MWIALAGGPGELRGELLQTCIRDIYRQVYLRDAQDPLVVEILNGLAC
jgi:hypothetical protein